MGAGAAAYNPPVARERTPSERLSFFRSRFVPQRARARLWRAKTTLTGARAALRLVAHSFGGTIAHEAHCSALDVHLRGLLPGRQRGTCGVPRRRRSRHPVARQGSAAPAHPVGLSRRRDRPRQRTPAARRRPRLPRRQRASRHRSGCADRIRVRYAQAQQQRRLRLHRLQAGRQSRQSAADDVPGRAAAAGGEAVGPELAGIREPAR